MNKTDSIARRIFGWSLNRWDRWYDCERGVFIHESEFQPEKNLDHAMLIVDKLKELGFQFTKMSQNKVAFNEIQATGENLAEAITNAAYTIIERNSEQYTANIWRSFI